jgi:phage gp36-like protein
MAIYATPTDLANYGLTSVALVNVPEPVQLQALQAAADEADAYIASQKTLPLVQTNGAWPQVLVRNVCLIAAADIMAQRGYNPDGSDEIYQLRAKDARAWLRDVAMQKATLLVADSSPAASAANGTTSATGPKVFSRRPRGWEPGPPQPGGGGGGWGVGGGG